MNKSGSYTVCLILSAMLCLALATPRDAEAQIFAQDITMRSTTTSPGMGGRGGGTSTGTEYFSKNAMRTNASDGKDTIVQFDAEKIITIDNKQKTYSEMTFKQLQDMLNQAGQALNQMNSEQMAAVRKMMGQMTTSFTVTKQGPGDTIAGYATEKYLLKGPMEIEIHSSSALKMPTAYFDIMKLQMPANPLMDMSKMFDEMKKIGGIPLKTVTAMKMMGQEMKTTKVVTSVEKGAVPASVFQVPAGYKLVQEKMNQLGK